jgi:hypothetical protein
MANRKKSGVVPCIPPSQWQQKYSINHSPYLRLEKLKQLPLPPETTSTFIKAII